MGEAKRHSPEAGAAVGASACGPSALRGCPRSFPRCRLSLEGPTGDPAGNRAGSERGRAASSSNARPACYPYIKVDFEARLRVGRVRVAAFPTRLTSEAVPPSPRQRRPPERDRKDDLGNTT
ncbi:hypothetical protein HPB47_008308 [Ixodes persulcatus]|uniref:Uncharacterized protein n=1 Tax=Ixodes persulcatus TaxID=34615 RepID=A0AC60P568_IXOPE|nr:hypothetical protein HPB47_008308 [Ixodes persulcatus]